ncbi:MAG: hypothetical protein QW505_02570 [Thermoplasmata archaeon]
MPRERYSSSIIAKRIFSLISGVVFEIGFILFIILLVLGVTSAVALLHSLVG